MVPLRRQSRGVTWPGRKGLGRRDRRRDAPLPEYPGGQAGKPEYRLGIPQTRTRSCRAEGVGMGNPSAPAAPRSPARPAPMGTEAVMKFLFDDESFSFEALRTARFTLYGGADLGEVLATARHIGEGDEAGWHRAWKASARRLQATGENARAAGQRVSAREPCCEHRITTAP